MTACETMLVKPRARSAIDDGLIRFGGRTLVTGTEVVDFLLDLRLVLDLETAVDAHFAAVPS